MLTKVAAYLALTVNSHICDARLLLQPLLKTFQLFRGDKEFNIRLLVHIPAEGPVNFES